MAVRIRKRLVSGRWWGQLVRPSAQTPGVCGPVDGSNPSTGQAFKYRITAGLPVLGPRCGGHRLSVRSAHRGLGTEIYKK